MARAASGKPTANPATPATEQQAKPPESARKVPAKKAAAVTAAKTQAAPEPQAKPPARKRKAATPVDAAEASQLQPAATDADAGANAGTQAAAATATPAAQQEQAAPAPSREQRVREAAYQRYLARGQAHGHHENDWLEAEREVDGPQQQGGRKAG